MKKYMKEIVDLGSPVSPKLGKCSPRFRRKILNIVQKISVISYDNAEEDEFKDQEKKRKNSLKELPVLPALKAHKRSFSLNKQLCSSDEQRRMNSNETALSFAMQVEEGEKFDKTPVMDSSGESENEEAAKKEKNTTNSEEVQDFPENFSAARKDSKDSGDLDASPKFIGRPSLKDELLGFDFSGFNAMSDTQGEETENY